MAVAKAPQTLRSNRVAIASANAGARDGTGAATGIAGVAAGTIVRRIRWAMTGGDNDNTVLRIFKHDGTNYALLIEVPIMARVVVIGGMPTASGVVGLDVLLPSSSYTLRYSMETADPVVITEEGYDY